MSVQLEITEHGYYVIYRNCRYRRTYFQGFFGDDGALWSVDMTAARRYRNQADAFEGMMDILDRQKARREKRKQEVLSTPLYPSRTSGRQGVRFRAKVNKS